MAGNLDRGRTLDTKPKNCCTTLFSRTCSTHTPLPVNNKAWPPAQLTVVCIANYIKAGASNSHVKELEWRGRFLPAFRFKGTDKTFSSHNNSTPSCQHSLQPRCTFQRTIGIRVTAIMKKTWQPEGLNVRLCRRAGPGCARAKQRAGGPRPADQSSTPESSRQQFGMKASGLRKGGHVRRALTSGGYTWSILRRPRWAISCKVFARGRGKR